MSVEFKVIEVVELNSRFIGLGDWFACKKEDEDGYCIFFSCRYGFLKVFILRV